MEIVLRVEEGSDPISVSYQINPENGITYVILPDTGGLGRVGQLEHIHGIGKLTISNQEKTLRFGVTAAKLAKKQEIPLEFSLGQNYPNPFNPTTEIRFALPVDGNIALKLYDILGREVRTLAEGYYVKGYYNLNLDATSMASGVYFYRLTSAEFSAVKKLMIIK